MQMLYVMFIWGKIQLRNNGCDLCHLCKLVIVGTVKL